MSHISNEANTDLAQVLGSRKTASLTKITNLLDDFIEKRREVEKQEEKLKTTLKEVLKPEFFNFNEDADEAGVVTNTFDLNNLQINFVNSYFIKNEEHRDQILKLLGNGHPLADHIVNSTKLTVEVGGLHSSNANALAKGITKLAGVYGVKPEVVSKAVTTPEFHNLRHVYLSKEDNLALDEVLPLQIAVTPID